MPPARIALFSVLALRIAYGAALVAAPQRVTKRWIGAGAERGPARVPLRALGAREVVLHGLALGAALRGAPVGPWLAGSAAGDLVDVAATAASRAELPDGAAPATAAVAGGSALLSLALAATAGDQRG
jgi:hypothetical protein